MGFASTQTFACTPAELFKESDGEPQVSRETAADARTHTLACTHNVKLKVMELKLRTKKVLLLAHKTIACESNEAK